MFPNSVSVLPNFHCTVLMLSHTESVFYFLKLMVPEPSWREISRAQLLANSLPLAPFSCTLYPDRLTVRLQCRSS